MTDVTIALVNFHMAARLKENLPSIFSDIRSSAYDIKLVVVDNSQNSDGIKEILASDFPDAIYLDATKNIGFGAANNLAFQAYPARYYFALNTDVVMPKSGQSIDQMVTFMDDNLRIGALAPKLLNTDGSVQHSCFRFDRSGMLIKPFRHLGFDKKFSWAKRRVALLEMRDFKKNHSQPVDWVLGAAMMVRHDVTKEIGFFDESYFLYLEDCDWCHRMWEAGWPVYYVHHIELTHHHDRGSAKVPGIIKALIKNPAARQHLLSWLRYNKRWWSKQKYYLHV